MCVGVCARAGVFVCLFPAAKVEFSCLFYFISKPVGSVDTLPAANARDVTKAHTGIHCFHLIPPSKQTLL